ncbi:hypothetical protein CYLTODRAFT_360315 [Cylindrobasidium torrendii FP15055 ss-10]|uniref:Uncharacterized protein n=1 Tax=Cylindrobasidium torrendii FP15055 ss-10 TaxID=1314674 RepID=A0A0D7AYD7_9AGAR|nr:hypothetical protein CYLTODRAFT_360315 [Cylindrobasidium torrendii FP15055 ss-10]
MQAAADSTTSITAYIDFCADASVNGNVPNPFWENLPFTNIHVSQTPDVLHQLYQGLIKYLIAWCQKLLTEKELDRRIRRLPPAFGLRHFKNGISALSQISGTERKNMAKILLGCVHDVLPRAAVTACRALLDFVYLAQYPTHDDTTLGYMESALDSWRQNKHIFLDLNIREDFLIPKIHSLTHYVDGIRLFGTTNNFNTEMFKRLHIEFAKNGWRASNRRDEFPQMTEWVTRQETVHDFEHFVEWVPKEIDSTSHAIIRHPSKKPFQQILLPKRPSYPRKALSVLAREYGIRDFPKHLAEYISLIEHERARRPTLYRSDTLPFQHLDVYYSFKLTAEGLHDPLDEEHDWVKASPLNGGRYDTVVVLNDDDAEVVGLQGEASISGI